MGYHIKQIPKGELGFSSKMVEELAELQDAEDQGNMILAACEAADLYGALEAWAEKFGWQMADIKKMSDATRRTFKDGSRK